VAASGCNHELVALLDELGWTPARLAREINDMMRCRQVVRQTVSDWTHLGSTPRDPLPTVVAHLLSVALNRAITVEQLWLGRAKASTLWLPADAGINLPWTPSATVAVLDSWLQGGGPQQMDPDRREFMTIAGAALTVAAWGYVDSSPSRLGEISLGATGRGSLTITAGMVDVVKDTIKGLRALDDTGGGNTDNLRFIHHHLLALADWLRHGRFASTAVGDQLLGLWAQLAQLAGWVAQDAERHGLAQRYWRSGLHAAHTAGARDVGAYILSCMAYQAIGQDRVRDAMELADAAMDAAKNTPASVRALVVARYARAQATMGNVREFRARTEEAQVLLARPDALDTRPAWLYWFERLDTQTGLGLLDAVNASNRNPKALLDEADAIMSPRFALYADTMPRDVVLETLHLARAHVRHGDVDQALSHGWTVLDKARAVSSAKCLSRLRGLDAELAAHRRIAGNTEVRAFRRELAAVRTA